MALRYVDPAAAGANNGTSWTDAWTDVQSAFDTATAGDTVYCRGTQTVAARIDIDTQTGTNAGGFIKFIGCNAAGTVDGTRFTIQGDGVNACDLLYKTGAMHMIWIENFQLKSAFGAGSSGLNSDATNGSGWVFINCSFNLNGQYGVNVRYFTRSTFIQCAMFSNTSHGVYYVGTDRVFIFFTSIHGNTGAGIHTCSGLLYGDLIYDNGGDGVDWPGQELLLLQCSIDINGDDGINYQASAEIYASFLLGCRITNHTAGAQIGLNCNSEPVVTGWCYFENNTGANIQNDSLHSFIPNLDGTTTNVEDAGDTSQGYTDLTAGSEDYNLRASASLRRVAITIPTS